MAEQMMDAALLDPDTGVTQGPAMIALISHLRPAPHHLTVRGSLSASAANHHNITWIRKALDAYQSRDYEVVLLLDGMERGYEALSGAAYHAAMPNAPLTSPLLNDYINRYSLTTCSVLKQLGDQCPKRVIVRNEPNLEALTLAIGGIPTKPSAMAPETYAALLQTTASRIRELVPAVQHIYPAALSCLIRFSTDPAGPWLAGYWRKVFGYLLGHGVHLPWSFEGLAVNCEGPMTDHYSGFIAEVMGAVKREYGLSGPNIVSEWGVPSGRLVEADMRTCYAALAKHFDLMGFFQFHTYQPDDLSGYGICSWGVVDGQFIPKAQSAWYPLLQKLYATP